MQLPTLGLAQRHTGTNTQNPSAWECSSKGPASSRAFLSRRQHRFQPARFASWRPRGTVRRRTARLAQSWRLSPDLPPRPWRCAAPSEQGRGAGFRAPRHADGRQSGSSGAAVRGKGGRRKVEGRRMRRGMWSPVRWEQWGRFLGLA